MKRFFAVITLLFASAAFGQGVFSNLYQPTPNNNPSNSLNLSIAAGRVFCNGAMVSYAGGTLAMTASATNYVYLNTASSCIPAVKPSDFTINDIPIAVVVAGSSSLTSINDRRTMFVRSNVNGQPISPSSVTTPVVTAGNLAVNVKSYGAKGDGTTDDGPAIRAATALGFDVYFPCSASPYYVNSLATGFNNNNWVLEPGPNQTIFSDGPGCATIKMGDGLVNSGGYLYGNGMLFFHGVSNSGVKNITIDMNGGNNLVPSGQIRNAIAIYGVGASNINVSNVRILDPSGQNAISFDTTSSYITIDHVHVRGAGTALAGNTYQTDWSALYSEADHTSFSHNTIVNSLSGYPFAPAAGIEMHGNYQTAIDNDITYAYPCSYINPISVSGTQTQVRIVDMHCHNAGSGVILTGGNYSNIEIGDSDITLTPLAWGSVIGANPVFGVYQYPAATNTITSSQFHDLVVTETDGSEPTVGAASCFSFWYVNNVQVHHNNCQNMSAYAVLFSSPTSGVSNVVFDHNLFQNFGYNSGPDSHLGFNLGSAGAGSVSGLSITDNTLALPTLQAGASAFYMSWNASTTLSSIAVSRNPIINIGTALTNAGGTSYTSSIAGYDPLQWVASGTKPFTGSGVMVLSTAPVLTGPVQIGAQAVSASAQTYPLAVSGVSLAYGNTASPNTLLGGWDAQGYIGGATDCGGLHVLTDPSLYYKGAVTLMVNNGDCTSNATLTEVLRARADGAVVLDSGTTTIYRCDGGTLSGNVVVSPSTQATACTTGGGTLVNMQLITP